LASMTPFDATTRRDAEELCKLRVVVNRIPVARYPLASKSGWESCHSSLRDDARREKNTCAPAPSSQPVTFFPNLCITTLAPTYPPSLALIGIGSRENLICCARAQAWPSCDGPEDCKAMNLFFFSR